MQVPKQNRMIDSSTAAAILGPKRFAVRDSYEFSLVRVAARIRRDIEKVVDMDAIARRAHAGKMPEREKAKGRERAPAPRVAEQRLNMEEFTLPGRTV